MGDGGIKKILRISIELNDNQIRKKYILKVRNREIEIQVVRMRDK